MYLFETKRLRVRTANFSDASFFLKLLNEPAYIANIRDSQVRSLEDARKFIQKSYLDQYDKNGFGLYVIETKNLNEPIGVCGFVKRDDLPHPDLGFALLEQEAGHGYIIESAKAILEYGKTSLGMTKVLGVTVAENVRSQNTLKKIGFVHNGQVKLSHTEKMLELFEITLKNEKSF